MYYDRNEKTKKKIAIIMIVVAIIVAIGFIYKNSLKNKNEYIIKGNGRIEGREISISTKFSGRILELKVDEGDVVQKGDLLAVLDSRSLSANLDAEKAKAEEIEKQIISTSADIQATESDVKFYQKEVSRSKTLIRQNFSSQLELDKNINYLEKAEAKLAGLQADKKALQASHDSLLASIKAKEIDLGDMEIYAPADGVILYKLVENGEMLANNGKLFVMYNPDDLYMTIYMSSNQAGQVKIGEEAMIKLDAYKNKVFPATVTFVAENAEFTPKEVETQQEREKLVFRIKVTLDDNSKREAKPGMPGEGFIKIDDSKEWPTDLQ